MAFVRIITMLLGLLSTSILSHGLDLTTYGTYSQGNLLVAMMTSLSILGFTDGVNYFFNKQDDPVQKARYIDTLFGLQLLIGIALAAMMLLLRDLICAYFESDGIKPFLPYLCLMPLLSNYLAMLQNMYISVGKAKHVAARSVILAVVKLLAICLCVFWTKNIGTIFFLMLLLDLLTVAYFYIAFSLQEFRIRLFRIDRALIGQILRFCIPVAVFVVTNTLCREMDKWVVARMGDTEELAIYTNAALPLPVGIVSSAVMTVIIPQLTRFYHRGELTAARELIFGYMKIGYLTTFVLGGACLLLSEELILFLYGTKYLAGLGVFRLYILVDILKFANLSVLLSIAGKTKELMRFSLLVLVANVVLNIGLYSMFGMIGPAVATVIVSFANILYLLWRGASVLQSRWTSLIAWKHLALFVVELALCALAVHWLRILLQGFEAYVFVTLISCGSVFGGTMLLLNWKGMKQTFVCMNHLEEKNHG